MATAKSLKRLRSASNAFLEDGCSLLNGVDGLLRELHGALDDLRRREEVLIAREQGLEIREKQLNQIIEQLAEKTLAFTAPTASLSIVAEPTPTDDSPSGQEGGVANELDEIQEIVAHAVVVPERVESNKLTVSMATPSRFGKRRKRRR